MRSLLHALHCWVWRDARRRGGKLLRFAETEADGGRDLVRAAELTADPLLRRLYLTHASDERRHADLFRRRGAALLHTLPVAAKPGFEANWLAPGERGLDDLRVDDEDDGSLLAFLHLSEKAAATGFAAYRDALDRDRQTQALFARILHDEGFHMKYTLTQLARVSPKHHRILLWRARLSRLWKGYLRLAVALASVMGSIILILQYFILMPPFALLAKRAARRKSSGWTPVLSRHSSSLIRQY